MPEGEDFDAASSGIELVVEVIASTAEKKAANALLLGVASSCSDAWRRGGMLPQAYVYPAAHTALQSVGPLKGMDVLGMGLFQREAGW